MPTLNPDDLRKRLETELEKINGGSGLLPEINNSNDFAKPFIEIDRYGYNYVCRERGEEIFRKLPFDNEELTFEIFKDVTREMAWNWELKNRKPNEDSRRQVVEKQIELMAKLDKSFGDRIKKEIGQILRLAPYQD